MECTTCPVRLNITAETEMRCILNIQGRKRRSGTEKYKKPIVNEKLGHGTDITPRILSWRGF